LSYEGSLNKPHPRLTWSIFFCILSSFILKEKIK